MCVCVCEEKEKLIVPRKTRVCVLGHCLPVLSSLIEPQKPVAASFLRILLLIFFVSIFYQQNCKRGKLHFFFVLLF